MRRIEHLAITTLILASMFVGALIGLKKGLTKR